MTNRHKVLRFIYQLGQGCFVGFLMGAPALLPALKLIKG